MYPTPSRDLISKRLASIASKGAALYERALRGDPMGPRELAETIELNQQYYDLLCELEEMDLEIYEGEAVEVML